VKITLNILRQHSFHAILQSVGLTRPPSKITLLTPTASKNLASTQDNTDTLVFKIATFLSYSHPISKRQSSYRRSFGCVIYSKCFLKSKHCEFDKRDPPPIPHFTSYLPNSIRLPSNLDFGHTWALILGKNN
jgi:hypothetical protein